jgi:hypothetical protein
MGLANGQTTRRRTRKRKSINPQTPTIQRLDLRQGEISDILAHIWVYLIPFESRLRISALGSVDDLVVPYDYCSVFCEAAIEF